MMLNNHNNVKIVYHIGDIHIRKNNDRDKEYAEVFEKTCEEISKNSKNAIVVCAGDVFHDGLSPTAIVLAKDFFMKICEICDVIVFRGNHDQANKSNAETMDYLFPILYKLETKNKIHILEKSGIYEYGNVVFGYTDVYDQHVFKMEGYDDKIKIGLWHGTISGSKNDAGMDLTEQSKFNVGDFENYDYVMLGDIHKAQYVNSEKTIAYCGSLIQQNHGESLDHHGLIKWDIVKKTSKFIEIPNDYGYVTVIIKNEESSQLPELPPNVNLRIIHDGANDEYVKTVYLQLSEKSNIVNFEDKKELIEFNFADVKETDVNEVEHSDDATVNRLMKYIDDNEDKITITEEDKKEVMEILKRIVGELEYNYEVDKKSIKMKSLVFNNFNVYGVGNCIDYEAMRGIINLCGRNGIGKSSVAVHALLYAIYGLCEESSVGKYDYINNKKKDMYTSVIFDVNGNEYRIDRKAMMKDKKRTVSGFTHHVVLYKNGDDISMKNAIETNKEIVRIIGDSDSLINLCIMEQKRSASFLNLSDVEKKDFICNLLKLDIYNNIHDKLAQEVRQYNMEISVNNKRIYTDVKDKTTDRSSKIEQEIDDNERELVEMMDDETKIEEEYNEVNKECIEKNMKLKELQKIDFDNIFDVDVVKKMEDKKKELEELRESKDEIMTSIDKNKKKIDAYVGMEKKKKVFDNNKNKEVTRISAEINELWKGFVTITDCKTDIDEMISRKDKIDMKQTELKTKIAELNENIKNMEIEIKEYSENETNADGYAKYNEMKNEEKIIDDKEKVITSRIAEISELLQKNKKQYNKMKRMIDDKIEEQKDIDEKLKEFKDIDKRLNKYEKDKKEKVAKMMEDIQDKMKQYEKIDEYAIVDETEIRKIKKQKDKLLDEMNKIDESIIELNNKIVEVDDDVEKKYEIYCKCKKACDNVDENIMRIKRRLEELKEHTEMLKNHRFNPKCEICMSNDLTKDKISTAKRMEELKGELNEEEQNRNSQYVKLDKYKKYGDMKIFADENEKIKKQIEDENKKKEKLQRTIDSYEMKINSVEKRKNNKEIDAYVSKCREHIDAIQNEKFAEYETYKKIYDDKKIILDDITNAKAEIKEYDNLMQDEEDQQHKVNEIQTERERLLKKYKKYVKYGEMYEKNEEKEDIVNKMRSELKELTHEMEKIQMQNEKINRGIDEYNKFVENKKQNAKIKKMINKKTEELEVVKNETLCEYVKYTKLKENINKLNETLSTTQIQIKETEIALMKLNKDFEENEELLKKKGEYDILTKETDELTKKYNGINEKRNELKQRKSEIDNRIIELKTELKSINKSKDDIKEIEKKRQMSMKVIEIIKNGFVDNLLTKKIIPNFCDSVNSILTSFVDYKISMEYENKKLCVYKKDVDGLLSCASKLSGYETLMANIAFRLAISNINKLYKTNFFIIDEAFAFCDETSITKISNLFEYMKKIYDFVIVVSHNEQIKSYTDIDIPIRRKNGYSYVNMIDHKNKNKFEKYHNIMMEEQPKSKKSK